jgi:hypothetical protein
MQGINVLPRLPSLKFLHLRREVRVTALCLWVMRAISQKS